MRPVGAEVGSYLGEGAGPRSIEAYFTARRRRQSGNRGTHRRCLRGLEGGRGALAAVVSRSSSATRSAGAGAQIARRAAIQPIMCTPRDVTKSLTAQRPATTIGEERGAATGSVVSPTAAPRARISSAATPSPRVDPASLPSRTLTTSCRRLVKRSKAKRPLPSVAAMPRRSSRNAAQASRSSLRVGEREALVEDPLFGAARRAAASSVISAKLRGGPRRVAGTTTGKRPRSAATCRGSLRPDSLVPVERNINSPSSNAKSRRDGNAAAWSVAATKKRPNPSLTFDMPSAAWRSRRSRCCICCRTLPSHRYHAETSRAAIAAYCHRPVRLVWCHRRCKTMRGRRAAAHECASVAPDAGSAHTQTSHAAIVAAMASQRVGCFRSETASGGNTLASTAAKQKKAVLPGATRAKGCLHTFSGPLLGSPSSSLHNAADAAHETARESPLAPIAKQSAGGEEAPG